jgi:HlyD family secretion protein
LVGQRRAEVRRATSNRKFREIMYERIKKLNEAQSVDDKLVDAKFEERDSARAWEEAANLAIKTAEADVKAKAAKIDQAKADLLEARAKVEVATAAWDKARVFVQFTKIVSSYDGVVTRRSYHNGDFISEGKKGQSPLLMVQRTDLMRVLVSVPDVDVPYLREGDPAELLIESLPPERKFSGYDERKHQLLPSPRVSRISRSQDLTSRTMPIEIDVPNNDDLLCDGMYGAVTIHLRAGSLSALTLPSSSLVHPAGHEDNKPAPKGKRQNGHAWVYVVRDGRAKLTPVKVGLDSGSEVEIISGLNRDDLVVIQAEGALADGTPVLVPSQEGTFHGGLH